MFGQNNLYTYPLVVLSTLITEVFSKQKNEQKI